MHSIAGSSDHRRVAAAAFGLGVGLWAGAIEPRLLFVRRVGLELPGWPQALRGLRAAVVGDLHVGAPHVGMERLARVVERVNAAAPEVVFLLGDYVTGRIAGARAVEPGAIAAHLAALRAPLGVYAVLGNNDDARVERALRSAGLRVLENDVAWVRRGGVALAIAGVGEVRRGNPDLGAVLRALPEQAAAILLTHSPDLFPAVPGSIALTIAGHTHGGQLNIPLLRRALVPSLFGARYRAGHIIEHGRHLYVTRGVGTSLLPVRLGAPPEIALLTLGLGPIPEGRWRGSRGGLS